MLGKTAGGIQFVVMIAVIDSPYRGRLDSASTYRCDGMMPGRQILIEARILYLTYCFA